MDLSQLFSLPATEFARLVDEDYFDCNGIYIIEVYNALMRSCVDYPSEVVSLAKAAIDVYLAQERPDEAILYMELYARTELIRKDVGTALTVLESIAQMDHERSEDTILELADDILGEIDTFGVSIDQRPRIMRSVAAFFSRYEQSERIVDLYLQAANLYSRHGAPQAATRCVTSAKSISEQMQCSSLVAKCHLTMLAVHCEAEEYQQGVDAANLAIDILTQSREPVPAVVMANLGVAYMNLNDPENAIRCYELALGDSSLPTDVLPQVRTNYAICLRRCGLIAQAASMMEIAIEHANQDFKDPEGLLEMALSDAKIVQLLGDTPLLISRLKEVVTCLDSVLKDVLRLHHRRGLRARYFWRIEELLASLPASGFTHDVLAPLISLKGNAMGDWLTILMWADRTRADASVDPAVLKKIDDTLMRIREIGAPHLFGGHEQKDDAWNEENAAQAWDELSNVAALIYAKGKRPLDLATSEHQVVHCLQRLQEHHCVMLMTSSKEEVLLWYFLEGQYRRVQIPLDVVTNWSKAQVDHAQQFLDRAGFQRSLLEAINCLAPLLDPVFQQVSASGCKTVRFLEDRHCELPLMALVLRNAELATKMEKGTFEFRMVPTPVLQGAGPVEPVVAPVAIIDPEGDLHLAPYEAAAFSRAAGLRSPATLHTNGEGSLLDVLRPYDALVVSTHGHSLKFFQDAYFAHLGNPGEPHLIKVSSMQAAAPDLRLKIALLNTCYSGSRSTKNGIGEIVTNDSVAIPNLFLLNGHAVALAGSWKVFDIVSFALSISVGEALHSGLAPSSALASAIARLHRMRKSDLESLLEKHLPTDMLTKILQPMQNQPDKGIFAHPYHTSGMAIHGLL
jgi:tetratricopeptide (TPR) repeat protein